MGGMGMGMGDMGMGGPVGSQVRRLDKKLVGK